MVLRFRNLSASPSDPVESWPYEGLVTALERGSLRDWVRIAEVIRREPFGPVATDIEAYLSYADPSPVGRLFARVVADARRTTTPAQTAAHASHPEGPPTT